MNQVKDGRRRAECLPLDLTTAPFSRRQMNGPPWSAIGLGQELHNLQDRPYGLPPTQGPKNEGDRIQVFRAQTTFRVGL